MDMVMNKTTLKISLPAIFAAMLLSPPAASAAARTASVTGAWDNTATWGGQSVPVAGDTVTVNNGITVTVPASYTAYCDSVTILTGNANSGIVLAAADSVLDVRSGVGTVTISAPTGNVTKQIDVGSGQFFTGSISITSGSTSTRYSQIAISTGTAVVSGNISFAGTAAAARIYFTGGGTLHIGGNLGAGGALTASTGTVNYNSSGNQSVGAYSYYNLTLGGGGTKTLAGATTILAGGTLTIDNGVTLDTSASNFTLNIGGNFVNNGTFTANASAITINGTAATQSIDGFTTTGTVSMTKTAGTATFLGNVNGGGLTINGSGGTLNLGAGLTHTFTGNWTRTAGTLNGGTSVLQIGGSVSGTGGTFTASTGTVEWFASGDQTIAGVSYYNLLLSGGGTKTQAAATTILANGSLTINPGVTLNTSASNFALNIGGNFVSNGTFTANASAIAINGTAAVQSIDGFTTTGTVSMTKTAGTATFLGNVNGGGLTINGSGGTLNLGSGLTHTFTGAWTRTAGTLNGGTSVLRIGGSVSGTGGTFTAANSTVEWFAAGNQTVAGVTYNHLTLSGGGSKALAAAAATDGTLLVSPGVTFTTGTNYALTLRGDFIVGGTFTAGSSAITIAGTAATQSIDGFTTTGTVSMTKTAGTATFLGNVNGGGLTINGSGGTLDLGTGLTHTFTGTWTRTAGTLNGGSSTLRIGLSVSGTGGTFNAGTGTVEWFRAGNQTLAAVTYNNLILSGSGTKTTTGATVNGVLTRGGTAAVGGTAPAYGAAATLRYAGTGAQTTGIEFPAIFPGAGGVIIANTSGNAVTLNAAKTISGPLAILPGAIFTTSASNYALTFTNLSNQGTFNANGSTVTVNGNWSSTGTFNAGTSTVNFATAGTASVSGNNSFNNFLCTTSGKALVFAQGSTQTVGGLFRINGTSFDSNVSLASSGGAGTTWSLVLNGRYDCKFVAVQGSNASGTAFLPISPAGYVDNGDNSNWFDPALPPEMLFHENFETCTNASAPPDRPSSNWTISGAASWLTQAATTSNTMNHTTGGTKSMYSSGGNAGTGIGAWNNPGWGPLTNVSASAWFYDDMQPLKRQWLFLDNAAATQGAGIMIDNTTSAANYVFCSKNGSYAKTATSIPRTLGWHQMLLSHSTTGTEVFIDGTLAGSTATLSDINSFDVGSWSWDNVNGNTPMWFDDLIVFRNQTQTRFRWFENNSAQTPSPLAPENTSLAGRNQGFVTRLRLQVQNNLFSAWAGSRVTLQYRQGPAGSWENLGASSKWEYADGLGPDGTQVSNALLTGTNVREYFVESVPSSAALPVPSGQYGEWDFCIRSTATVSLGVSYQFRLVLTDASGIFQQTLAAYARYPEISVVESDDTYWLGGVDSNWDVPGNWTNGVPTASKDATIVYNSTRNCRLNISGAVCKTLLIEAGRSLTLDMPGTGLTAGYGVTVLGTLTHNNSGAALQISNGILLVDAGGVYDHTAGAISAPGATIQAANGGQYNVLGAASLSAYSLNISSGGIVNVSGAASMDVGEFVIEDGGQWLNTNTASAVNVAGDFTNNGSMAGSTGGAFTMTANAGTLSGTSSDTVFHSLAIAGSMTSEITGGITVLGNFSIASGKSFSAGSGNLKVGGNWTNSGSFSPDSGTVTLDGSDTQSISAGGAQFNSLVAQNSSSGGIVFNDGFTAAQMICITPGSKLTFAAGQRYDITAAGGLNLQGAPGQLVKLRSSTPGSIWIINPLGASWTASHLDIQDSVNIYHVAILPSASTDSGNNTNWFAFDINRDTNNDGIADWWEYYYYSTLSGLTANTDTDGDGVNNLLEFVLESNPLNPASPPVVYVSCTGPYGGDGTPGSPYRYLDTALDNAAAGTLLRLASGTYALSRYELSRTLAIMGASSTNTFIQGPLPDGSAGNTGQMLDITGSRFAISDLTISLYKDDRPVISYNVASSGFILFQNCLWTGNEISSRSILAPSGTLDGTAVNLINSVFCSNSCGAAVEMQGAPFKSFNNTIVNNTGTGLLASGSGESVVTDCIVRGNTAQISKTGTGPLAVTYSNVQGGHAGAGNYDSAENYINPVKNNYRILPGTPAENAGIATFAVYDNQNIPRPQGGGYDVGAYEIPVNDYDNDGLSNTLETVHGASPINPDTDTDGMEDGAEVSKYGTDPTNPDSDGDLVLDGAEPPIGMNPALFDGHVMVEVYYESFENDASYPAGPWSGTIWGADTKYDGEILVVYDPPEAYNGDKFVTFVGDTPPSYIISFIPNNGLAEWWISTAFKFPRVRLPNDYNEACNIGGCFFALDENGFFCVYDPSAGNWRTSAHHVPSGDWCNVMIHRNTAGKYCDILLYNEDTLSWDAVYSNIPVIGPDLGEYIRIGFSSANEYDLSVDLMIGYNEQPD